MNVLPRYDEAVFHGDWARCERIANVAVQCAPAGAQLSILEIGCGTGEQLVSLARKFSDARLTGIDISVPNITIAHDLIQREGVSDRIDVIQADYLTRQLGSFNVIISYSTLHLIPAHDVALFSKLENELAPGGVFINIVPFECVFNRVLFLVRHIFRACRCRFTDALVLQAGKLLVQNKLSEQQLRDRVVYMYMLPERIEGRTMHAMLTERYGLKLIREQLEPHASLAQPKHLLPISNFEWVMLHLGRHFWHDYVFHFSVRNPMSNQIFEAALGIVNPWYIKGIDFDAGLKSLAIQIDFAAGSRFAHPGADGVHPAHDTQTKRYRHLNFFQHECYLEVRVPRVKLPDGKVALVEPDWAGKLSGFTLLFEAFVLMLAQQMPFAAVSRITGESWHRVYSICAKYVDLAVDAMDLSGISSVAIDETSKERGQKYLTLVADSDQRKVIFVTDGKDSKTIESFAKHLTAHGGDVDNITSVSIDMSPAFIKGVGDYLPNARITFDKFHVIAHASTAVEEMRRTEQKTDPAIKGLRWPLLKGREKLSATQSADLDVLIAKITTKRTARAWLYKEQLRDILERKQINVVSAMLKQWCTNVMRSKVEPMKEVAKMIRNHFDGIVAWTQTRQTNGFIEALNGLFQAAKRKAHGYTNFNTMRTVIFLIAGKLDFKKFNAHAA